MIYYNTPLTSSFQSSMQILQSRSARLDLPISNAAKRQIGLEPEEIRNTHKNEHLLLHELHLGQDVMFQDPTNK